GHARGVAQPRARQVVVRRVRVLRFHRRGALDAELGASSRRDGFALTHAPSDDVNTVLIFTDTQRKDMVGCYGQPVVDTPNLDRLASQGIRFERAYTACPLCTPARGSIFTGLHPASCGAWGNSLPIYRHVPVMGEIARRRGVRAAHVGKWHLDGTHYNGTGQPDGGFEPDWWYDRANFLAELPPNKRELYRLET